MDTIFEDDFTASQIAHSNQATRIQIVGDKMRHGRVKILLTLPERYL